MAHPPPDITTPLTPMDIGIMKALRLNDDSANSTGLFRPQIPPIAAKLGCREEMSLSGVNRALTALKQRGLVVCYRPRTPDGKKRARRYRLSRAGRELLLKTEGGRDGDR